MTTQLTGGSTSNLDALSVAGAADFGTPTYGSVAMPRMVLSTAQSTTSGTSIDFTSIPSWVKRITVMFNGLSTNGTSFKQIQLGAGSIDATGYISAGTYTNSASAAGTSTTGILCIGTDAGAATTAIGIMTIVNMGSNTWCASSVASYSGTPTTYSASGSKTLSGTLDRIRLTTVNGTDTFDAGSVNLLLEG